MGVNGGRNRLRSVCIVGAGAAGLCALRHFAARPDLFGEVVAYEQSGTVGGTWNYSEQTGTDANGLPVHSSMYRDLHTNLPIQIMEFPDFPAENCTESYVHHTEVARYLRDYSSHFCLDKLIRFHHYLKQLSRDHTNDCWNITVHDLTENLTFTRQFDIVILCPGRHSVPNWPSIKSLNSFTGRMIHSHDYRCREPYTGHQVAVVGGGPSGIDIALEISKVADDVIFINRTKHFQPLPDNVHQINATLQGFKTKSIVIRKDEKTVEFAVDSVILATGYRFNLSYLDQESSGLHWNANDTIDGLYRHMINIEHPSMALMGVCQRSVLPFPLYHQQIQYYLRALADEIQLPSQKEMIEEVNCDLFLRKSIGMRDRDRHCLNVKSLIEYLRRLERDANLTPLASAKLKLFEEIEHRIRTQDIINYKKASYRIVDEEHYEEV